MLTALVIVVVIVVVFVVVVVVVFLIAFLALGLVCQYNKKNIKKCVISLTEILHMVFTKN